MRKQREKLIEAVRSELGPMFSEARARRVVRAVLEAAREPSDRMSNAGYEHVGAYGDDGDAQRAWSAMIDALLQEIAREAVGDVP